MPVESYEKETIVLPLETASMKTFEQQSLVRSFGMKVAVGAVAISSIFGAKEVVVPDTAQAVVSGNISMFTNGVASPVVKGSDRMILTNVDDAGELARKVRAIYLDKCIDSEPQTRFTQSIQRLADNDNDNQKYLQIKSLGESKDWRQQLKAAKLASEQKNYTIEYNRCTRPAWMPYVNVGVPNNNPDEKLEKDRVKSGCSRFDINWYKDKVWVLNPANQDTSGTTIFKFSWLGFESSINIPICSKVDLRNTDKSAYGSYTRTFVPHPLPIPYRTTEK